MRNIRCFFKAKYVDYLVWRYGPLGWPSIFWEEDPGEKMTEEILDWIIVVVKRNIELFANIDKIPVVTIAP